MKLNMQYQQFAKFCLVALGYNLIAYFIYSALVYCKCNYLIASSISFITGITLSYFLNKSMVFTNKYNDNKLVLAYFSYYLILLCISLAMLHILVDTLKISPYIAQVLVTTASAVVSYYTVRMIFQQVKTSQSFH